MNHQTHLDDLQVESIADSLAGVEVDLVITGSIAATESVKFIRSLRRLGAGVNVWVTKAALQFTTITSLEWASGRQVWMKFSGSHSHIGQADLCIVAPCSASFASRISMGLSDTPCSALVTSYLGQHKPLIIIPTMHQSLRQSPIIENNFKNLRDRFILLEPELLESKLKFPNPNVLADRVSFEYNRFEKLKGLAHSVILAYGGASEALDPVRKVTNISSGKLGSDLADYLQRNGVNIKSYRGSSEHKRNDDADESRFSTNEDLLRQINTNLSCPDSRVSLIILAAALSDFEVETYSPEKIPSKETANLKISLKKKPKIIQELRKNYSGKMIGFKLLDSKYKLDSSWKNIALEYIKNYQLNGIYVNFYQELTPNARKGFFIDEHFTVFEIENTLDLGKIILQKFFEIKTS